MAKAGRVRSQQSSQIEAFAEDLGRLLGTARAKADSWLGQREQISKQLAEIRDTATSLLSELGQQARAAIGSGRTAGRGAAAGPPRRRRRRKMSAAARAKIAAAQRLRWARQKQQSGQKGDSKGDKKR
jgi:hypothetical protein